MVTKNFIKLFIPPVFLKIKQKVMCPGYISVKKSLLWSGDYKTWAESQKCSLGYDSQGILEKVTNALIQVKEGRAIYERDSVLFDKVCYSWPVLSGLMWIAALNEGKLRVLDFGGSLGSSYFQNRLFLKTLKELRWNIVEQPLFVETGKKYFEDETLKFYNTIQEALASQFIDVILLSSVLQYIEKPYDLIHEIFKANIPYIILDRTTFIEGENDRITVQNVPESIYKASYPAWFFNEKKMFNIFKEHYDLVEEFTSYMNNPNRTVDGIKTWEKGFILQRRLA